MTYADWKPGEPIEDWEEIDYGGTVLMFWEASHVELEHALAVLRIYAPRGLDSVEWHAPSRTAVISDASGAPMVRLIERIWDPL
ncbi:MAG TPA: hypothetical protein VE967_19435 [Gemmatimonadaceae bacterium]|nr:hypothetical protein [Gemmatimonadaceae bacterium]